MHPSSLPPNSDLRLPPPAAPGSGFQLSSLPLRPSDYCATSPPRHTPWGSALKLGKACGESLCRSRDQGSTESHAPGEALRRRTRSAITYTSISPISHLLSPISRTGAAAASQQLHLVRDFSFHLSSLIPSAPHLPSPAAAPAAAIRAVDISPATDACFASPERRRRIVRGKEFARIEH
jgi:hypothetical protein